MGDLTFIPDRTIYEYRSEFCLKTLLNRPKYAGFRYNIGFNVNRLEIPSSRIFFEAKFIRTTAQLEFSEVSVLDEHRILMKHQQPDKYNKINEKDLNAYS